MGSSPQVLLLVQFPTGIFILASSVAEQDAYTINTTSTHPIPKTSEYSTAGTDWNGLMMNPTARSEVEWITRSSEFGKARGLIVLVVVKRVPGMTHILSSQG